VLVVQVEDKKGKEISKTDLAEAIDVIRGEAGELSSEAFAHSFQEGTRMILRAGKRRESNWPRTSVPRGDFTELVNEFRPARTTD
jgi:hypothetical protein